MPLFLYSTLHNRLVCSTSRTSSSIFYHIISVRKKGKIRWKIFYHLSDCQLLEKASFPWSYFFVSVRALHFFPGIYLLNAFVISL